MTLSFLQFDHHIDFIVETFRIYVVKIPGRHNNAVSRQNKLHLVPGRMMVLNMHALFGSNISISFTIIMTSFN